MPISTVLDEKPDLATVKPLIESSTFRSYRAYVDAGFEKDVPRSIEAQYERENRFLSAIQNESAPTRRITRMIRRKEGNTEYLTFTENWTGTDWVGREIDPVTDRIEGVLQIPNVTPLIDEKGQKIGKQLNGSKIKYEIPFDRATVDKLIEETGTDKNEIIYTVRTSNRRDNCNYDQFVNTTWQQAVEIMMKDGGFELDFAESLKRRGYQDPRDKDKEGNSSKK